MPSQSHPPSIGTLVADAGLSAAIAVHGRSVVTEVVRNVIEQLRSEIKPGGSWPSGDEIIARVKTLLAQRALQFPQRVINATGVLIHTNLGRVPWGPEQLCEISPRLTSYVSLEYDLAEGTRGKRGSAVEAELAALTGAEGAMVVNNNAAAVYLVLSALAWNREVVISRGELVQIGGGFRIPEILAKSGAVLREIGTTNQTNLADYERACGPQTALILKVHRSNFVQTGFVSEVDAKALAALGKKKSIPVVWDVGSGAVGPGSICEFSGEPTLRACIGSGVDLVTSSGDKLFGGPQAGFVLGRRDLLDRLRSDPFYRALRPDKGTLLALEVTTRAHRSEKAAEVLPLYRLLAIPATRLKERGEAIASSARNHGHRAAVVQTADTFGGGAAPGKTIVGWGVRIDAPPSPEELSARARAFSPPIIATVSDNGVVFSLRTMFDADDLALSQFLS